MEPQATTSTLTGSPAAAGFAGMASDVVGRPILAYKLFLAAADVSAITFAFYISKACTGTTGQSLFPVIGFLLILLCFRYSFLYSNLAFSRSSGYLMTLTRVWMMGALGIVALLFFLNPYSVFERRVTIFLFVVFGWAALYVARFLIIPRLSRCLPQVLTSNVLFVGPQPYLKQTTEWLEALPDRHARVVGYVSEQPGIETDVPYLGTIENLPEIAREHGINEVFIHLEHDDWGTVSEILQVTSQLKVQPWIALKHFGVHFGRLNEQAMLAPNVQRGIVFLRDSHWQWFAKTIKRGFDVIGSLLGLLLFWPFFIVISFCIKAESPGPVFFRQRRIGKDGKPFTMLKFRSMREGNEERHKFAIEQLMERNHAYFRSQNGRASVLKAVDKSLVTRVGAILRRTSLDELPQIINVLLGQMSLVGPRPAAEYEARLQKGWHHLRQTVKPGMTGVWQVLGRSAVPYDDMMLMDIFYVTNWSVALDCRILARTAFVVLTAEGAI